MSDFRTRLLEAQQDKRDADYLKEVHKQELEKKAADKMYEDVWKSIEECVNSSCSMYYFPTDFDLKTLRRVRLMLQDDCLQVSDDCVKWDLTYFKRDE